jgi:hypothetical protein
MFPAFTNVNLEPMGNWELNPQPIESCLPCALEVSIEVMENEYAIANVTGTSGETVATWSLFDVELCVGDTLYFLDEESPCQSNLDLLEAGDIVTLTVSDEQGCEASATFTWTAINAINNPDKPEVRAFPNPSSGEITLIGLPLNASVTMLNAAGQSVWDQQTLSRPVMNISMHHLPAGWYFIESAGRRIPIILMPH